MQRFPKIRVKRGDVVKVLTGKDRGKQGKVIQVFPELRKVVVEGINTYKKHLRQRRENEKGQRVEFSAPIHISNVQKVKEEVKPAPAKIPPKKATEPSSKKTA